MRRVCDGAFAYVSNETVIAGKHCTIEGNNNEISGDNCTVIGNNNNVIGSNCKGRGDNNNVTGDNNEWKGNNNSLDGDNCKAKGNNNDLCGTNCIVIIRKRNAFLSWVAEQRANAEKKAKPPTKYVECPTELDIIEHDIPLADDADDSIAACCVCAVSAPICVCVPCLHKCLCCACARTLAGDGTKQVGEVKCPVCTKEVEKIGRVFE